MFSLQDGECEMVLKKHTDAVLDIDVEWAPAAMFDGPIAITASKDCRICVWDLLADSGLPPMLTLTGHTGAVTSIKVRLKFSVLSFLCCPFYYNVIYISCIDRFLLLMYIN